MKELKGFKDAKAFTEKETLPVGGYILGILDVNEIEYSWGNVLEFKIEIAEGDYKNFYTNQYKNSQLDDKKYKGTYRLNIPADDGSEKDELTMKIFKSSIMAIEESNPGYHWDWNEKGLINKKVGAVFFEKEYDFNGNNGFYTTIHSLKPIQAIKEGKFKIPAPKLLNKNNNFNPAGFAFAAQDDDLPF